MDHHCPWLGSCVGYHNFKVFFLFCIYQAVSMILCLNLMFQITGILYGIAMIKFAFFSPDETPDLSTAALIPYYFTNLFSFPVSLACIPFSCRIIIQLFNNLTTLEMLGNVQVKWPCIGTLSSTAQYAPNPYDMLWLPNMKQVLGPRMWMWPLPF